MGNLTARQVFTNPIHFLAYGFGAGLSPKAPGTAGTLVATPVYIALSYTSPWIYAVATGVAFFVGVYVCGYTAKVLAVDDPSSVVWDEVVGFLITMAFAPFGWAWIAAGFVLFRLFDIWKPWPIRWLDRSMKGGLGIMLDDVVAAVFAGIPMAVAAYFLKL